MFSSPPMVSKVTLMWFGFTTSQAMSWRRAQRRGGACACQSRRDGASQGRPHDARLHTGSCPTAAVPAAWPAPSSWLVPTRGVEVVRGTASGGGHRARAPRHRPVAHLLGALVVWVQLLEHVVEERERDERAGRVQGDVNQEPGRLLALHARHGAARRGASTISTAVRVTACVPGRLSRCGDHGVVRGDEACGIPRHRRAHDGSDVRVNWTCTNTRRMSSCSALFLTLTQHQWLSSTHSSTPAAPAAWMTLLTSASLS